MKIINTLFADPPKHASDLRQLVYSSAQRFGDMRLYTYKENKELKYFTYNDLARDMSCLGTAFSALGLRGKKIAVIGDTHPAWITAYYAAVNGGSVIVPLDRELRLQSVYDFLAASDAAAVVYTSGFNEKLTAAADKLPGVEYFIPIHEGETLRSEKVKPYRELIALGQSEIQAGNRDFIDGEIDMDALCAIIFTSGTTGSSKGVMLSQRNLTTTVNAACRSIACDSKSTFVSVLPPHHTYEMMCGHLALANLGGSVFINDSMKYTLRNFREWAPNTLILVPLFVETMHKRLWDEIKKKEMSLKVRAAMRYSNLLLYMGIDRRRDIFKSIHDVFGGKLECIICGGAPLSPQIISDFYTFGITILEGYGITECSPLVSVNRPGKMRLHTVGTPVDDCSVMIAPAEGEDTENGEILVKGGNVMLGYYNDPEATAAAFTDDGWFRTGDIGHLDSDGYIYITGRKKNVIILSNGKNIYPEELEEYLTPYKEISECVVTGDKNALGEIVITALIYPNRDFFEGKTDTEVADRIKRIVREVNRQLPSFKHIASIKLRDEEFEKNSSKKIMRFKIDK